MLVFVSENLEMIVSGVDESRDVCIQCRGGSWCDDHLIDVLHARELTRRYVVS